MINIAILRIIHNFESLIEIIKNNDSGKCLLSSILKIKGICTSLIAENKKIELIKERIPFPDILNLYYLIDGDIKSLDEPIISNTPLIGFIPPNFNELTREELNVGIDYVTTNFKSLTDEGNSLTDIINLIAAPKEKEIREAYCSSLDLPFSNKTLYLKVEQDNTIQFRLDNDQPWLVWEGSNFCYNMLKQNRFKQSTRWYIQTELELINKYIELFYTASFHYFKNIK